MVHTNTGASIMGGPYQEMKKGKDVYASPSPRYQQPQQQQRSTGKIDGKYGAWGPVYKNKENFIDMHIC